MTAGTTESLFVLDLKKNIRGDILSDKLSRGIYSTDASLYQILPVAIVLPKDEDDVLKAVQIARDHKVPILPRGGGTSLAGQTVGKALILDFSKYMNQILDFNSKEKWVLVQPGIIRDSLNDFLLSSGLIFSPDPATSSRANIGGMVGNNSSGTKSILYGKTVDHVLAMDVILGSGEKIQLNSHSPEEYDEVCSENTPKGKIYRGFRDIIHKYYEEIEKRFPKVMRRVSGYNLDEFKNGQDWNLSKVICGSEGTLGIITSVKLNLSPLPKAKSVCTAHFKDLMEALKAVKIAVRFNPSAVEIIDNEVISLAQTNPYIQKLTHFIEGQPNCILIIEFYGDEIEEIHGRQTKMIHALRATGYGYAFPIFDEGPEYDDVWSVRKNGLGILMGRKTAKKPLAFIEDSAVPVEVLPEYITQVKDICKKYNVHAAMYAHASVGVIHIRPILDMRDPDDIEIMKKISSETFDLVVHYGGSWSGEHGDGLVRSYKLEEYFGPVLYRGLKEVKQLFDPQNILNPGKIVDAQAIDQNLRYGSSYMDQKIDTVFKFRHDVSFSQVVHQCSGVGVCRKVNGTMCPSYHATRDEEHSTRGRANALRLAMSGQLENGDLTSPQLMGALDLCLSCKACKSECPTGVDMAKLKSEVLQKHHDQRGVSLRYWFIRYSASMSRLLSGPISPFVNWLLKTKLLRWILDKTIGIEKDRILPLYANEPFVKWAKRQPKQVGQKVVLFADTYLNYHEPGIGIAAFQLLSRLGFHVIVADAGCCQRPLISNGFLKKAKELGGRTVQNLRPYLEGGIPVLVCEPSCTSAFGDDMADLIDDEQLAGLLEKFVMPIESFLADHLKGKKLKLKQDRILLHGHCHQKTLYGTESLKQLFGDGELEEIDSGCCGMAGAFGYEKEHYQLSKKIGEERLFSKIRTEPNAGIMACGFSCRHQIEHFTGRHPKHWVEMVEQE